MSSKIVGSKCGSPCFCLHTIPRTRQSREPRGVSNFSTGDRVLKKATLQLLTVNEAISPFSSFLHIPLVDGEWTCGEQDENRETHMCISLLDQVADDFELDWVGGDR